ncbi:hypothetical protein [Staphylococcus kloosii]|uniref:hypothetical protein n=1 Tax=Staphylococcus kloosii TaxID=29384 RepID=UPI001E3D8FFA|nr:hypothetical protein [Staphylococcus kloosii]
MRIIILSLLFIINFIIVVHTLANPLTINNFSLRVILAALTFVLSLFFLLIRTTKVATYCAIITLILALLHIFIIAHSAYQYIY